LACRSLSSKHPENDLIQTELQLTDMLHRQILDHGTARSIASTTVTSAFLQNSGQLREQQQELFDDFVRRQQEKLFPKTT
jgi:hypothetical protein